MPALLRFALSFEVAALGVFAVEAVPESNGVRATVGVFNQAFAQIVVDMVRLTKFCVGKRARRAHGKTPVMGRVGYAWVAAHISPGSSTGGAGGMVSYYLYNIIWRQFLSFAPFSREKPSFFCQHVDSSLAFSGRQEGFALKKLLLQITKNYCIDIEIKYSKISV